MQHCWTVIPEPKSCTLLSGNTIVSFTDFYYLDCKEWIQIKNVFSARHPYCFTITQNKNALVNIHRDDSFGEEEYSLEITGKITIAAGGYVGVCHAVSTLFQILAQADVTRDTICIPNGIVHDFPSVSYRGLMIDTARSFHSISLLQQIVQICWWYKIRFLHLHLTDDDSFTFPWTALNGKLSKNQSYTKSELIFINDFAEQYGITIIPEIDLPGHSRWLVHALPQVFAPSRYDETTNVICIGKESTYSAIDTLLTEVCECFPTSPYLHIGGDEVDESQLSNCLDCLDYRQAHKNISNHALYHHFLNRLNEMVKDKGKRTIVWEGFSQDNNITIDTDITVMVFESQYYLPQDLVRNGYSIINCAWKPLYYTPKYHCEARDILNWNCCLWESQWEKSAAFPDGIQLAPCNNILGAQFCCWENPSGQTKQVVLERLPALSERLWNDQPVNMEKLTLLEADLHNNVKHLMDFLDLY